MKPEGIALSRFSSSVWAAPIAVAMKSSSQASRICDDYRMNLSALITVVPEYYVKCTPRNRSSSKVHQSDAYLQIPPSPQSKSLTAVTILWGLFQFHFAVFSTHHLVHSKPS